MRHLVEVEDEMLLFSQRLIDCSTESHLVETGVLLIYSVSFRSLQPFSLS